MRLASIKRKLIYFSEYCKNVSVKVLCQYKTRKISIKEDELVPLEFQVSD